VCVEGGLFIRGSTTLVDDPTSDARPSPERLVRISPFALDRDEMTVGAMRALVAQGGLLIPTTHDLDPACQNTLDKGPSEGLPINCVSRENAARACALRGMRLPTEAEWEYAAGDRDQQKDYPWGADDDVCQYAVVARGRQLFEGASEDASTFCRPQPNAAPLPWGPRPVAETSLDVNDLGLRHMAGNVSEWVKDELGTYDGPCGRGPRVLTDPRCDVPNNGRAVARGGNWRLTPITARVVHRGGYVTAAGNVEVGFRCAESM
jgi:formylglycine-generating enzyme required for sulfatase activity